MVRRSGCGQNAGLAQDHLNGRDGCIKLSPLGFKIGEHGGIVNGRLRHVKVE